MCSIVSWVHLSSVETGAVHWAVLGDLWQRLRSTGSELCKWNEFAAKDPPDLQCSPPTSAPMHFPMYRKLTTETPAMDALIMNKNPVFTINSCGVLNNNIKKRPPLRNCIAKISFRPIISTTNTVIRIPGTSAIVVIMYSDSRWV